jgi:assimilatory nitrate reductase catalytic subunit
VPILEALAPDAWIDVNPLDASSLGIHAGQHVRVSSARGEVSSIRVRVTGTVRPGEVFIPFHWDERCANRLTDDQFDPISREPNYKQCAVRIDPLVGAGAGGSIDSLA